MIDEKRQNKSGNDEEFDSESVVIVIVRRSKLHVNKVDRRKGSGHEHQLHAGIVHGDVSCHQVQVSG